MVYLGTLVGSFMRPLVEMLVDDVACISFMERVRRKPAESIATNIFRKESVE